MWKKIRGKKDEQLQPEQEAPELIGDGDDGTNHYRDEDDSDEDNHEMEAKQKSGANRAADTMSHDDL